MLLTGDKTGDDRFYVRMVPIADSLYDRHLEQLRREGLIWRGGVPRAGRETWLAVRNRNDLETTRKRLRWRDRSRNYGIG